MRRFVMGWAVGALALLSPGLAHAGDRETAQAIADALKGSGRLQNFSIAVRYKDGVAYLKGQVRSAEQAAEAIRFVESRSDVVRVENMITVAGAAPTSTVATRQRTDEAVRPTSQLTLIAPTAGVVAPSAPAVMEPAPVRSAPRPAARPASSAPVAKAVVPASRRVPVRQEPAPIQGEIVGEAPIMVQGPAPMQGAPAQMMPMQGAPMMGGYQGRPMPMYYQGAGGPVAPVRYDQPHMPNYAWPSYAAHPNYAAVTYPRQYSPTAWPYIGPFYPYPQVPLGWRKVTLEWDDGWWMLDFDDKRH